MKFVPRYFRDAFFLDRRIDILSPLSEGMSISGYLEVFPLGIYRLKHHNVSYSICLKDIFRDSITSPILDILR